MIFSLFFINLKSLSTRENFSRFYCISLLVHKIFSFLFFFFFQFNNGIWDFMSLSLGAIAAEGWAWGFFYKKGNKEACLHLKKRQRWAKKELEQTWRNKAKVVVPCPPYHWVASMGHHLSLAPMTFVPRLQNTLPFFFLLFFFCPTTILLQCPQI